MKILTPENENYAATVVTIKEIHPLEGSDRIVGTTIFGSQAIVGVGTTEVGTKGIYFPAFGVTAPGYWICVAIVVLCQIIGSFFKGSK